MQIIKEQKQQRQQQQSRLGLYMKLKKNVYLKKYVYKNHQGAESRSPVFQSANGIV